MRNKKTSAETRLAITSARWKAASAVYCANVLRPDLDEPGKRNLANANPQPAPNAKKKASQQKPQ